MNYRTILKKVAGLRCKGDTKQSFKEYKKLLKSKDPKIHLEGYQGMALCLKMDYDLKGALKYYDRAITVAKKLNNQSGLGDIYRDVAISYEYFSRFKIAEKFLLKSIETFRKLRMGKLNYAKLGITEVKLGLTYLHQKKLKEAEKWMKRGDRHLAKNKQADFWQLTSKMHLAELLYLKKKYKQVINKINPLLLESMNKDWDHRYNQILTLRAACFKKLNREEEYKHDKKLLLKLLSLLDSKEVSDSIKRRLNYYLK
ncbi:hypothetical protein E3J85_00270 [Patescibacteria group bacterium]|nr:MAG: hypothetical protein E3J85_00270 [Patescibacteria group bacterium]